MNVRAELHDLVRQLRSELEWAARVGVIDAPLEAAPVAASEAAAPLAAAQPAVVSELTLAAIREELGDCTRCKLHTLGRRQIVFGVGNPKAELMFIGEGPGANEDLQGEPFVGDAGQLLTKIIEAMGFKRSDVYIANVVKCLRYNACVLLENGSWERIGRLVRQKYAGRVMSVDEHGNLVPRRVIGWYTSPLGERRVLKLSYASSQLRGGNKANTQLTHDHEVLTKRGWIQAGELLPTDQIAIGQGLSEVAHELAVGTLLGDGHLNRASSHLSLVHSRDQSEYVHFKAQALRELEPIVYPSEMTVRGRKHLTIVCRTKATRALRVLRSRFYPEGKKRVPEGLELTARIAAIWFLDDGCTKVKSQSSAFSEIAAHSFSAGDIQRLIEGLKGLGIEAYTRESSERRIHFGAEASLRLSRLVAPYCPPSMRYKLHPQARSTPFDASLYEAGSPRTLYDSVIVEPVDFKGTDKTFYCIDVEGTHNFVTSGGVVHNCRPPQNRDPEPDEVEACEPFLKKQIASVRPKVIVTLGKYASQTILRTQTSITRLRGTWSTYEGTPVMPTYHPAYLLRNPEEKRSVWEDMKRVLTALGREPPQKAQR